MPKTDLDLEALPIARKKKASQYLGYAIDDGGKTIGKTFSITLDDICLKSEQQYCHIRFVSDLRVFMKDSSIDTFGINADIGQTVVSGRQVQVKRMRGRRNPPKKQGLVFTAIIATPCQLKKEYADLEPAPFVVNKQNLGVTYIRSGTLLVGYHMIIEGRFSKFSSESKDIREGLNILFEKVETHLRSKRSKDTIRVNFEGIGGYDPDLEVMNANIIQVKEKAKELNERFLLQSKMLEGAFYHGNAEEGVETIEQEFSLKLCATFNEYYLGKLRDQPSRKESKPKTTLKARATRDLKPTESLWGSSIHIIYDDIHYLAIDHISKLLTFIEDNGENEKELTKWRLARGVIESGKEFDDQYYLTAEHNKWVISFLSKNSPFLKVSDVKNSKTQTLWAAVKYLQPKQAMRVDVNSSDQVHLLKREQIPKLMPTSYKMLTERERKIYKFAHKTFPELYKKMLLGRSMTIFIGNTGAGKSATINALLGHNFVYGKTLVEKNPYFYVVDKTRSYAKMGKTFTSETKRPDFYQAEEKYNEKGGILTDFPGFKDTKGDEKTRWNNFYMFLTKEMAEEIKAIVVVFNYAELTGARGESFKSLINKLSNIIHASDLHNIENNLIFICNLQGIQPDIEEEDLLEEHCLEKVKELEKIYSEDVKSYEIKFNRIVLAYENLTIKDKGRFEGISPAVSLREDSSNPIYTIARKLLQLLLGESGDKKEDFILTKEQVDDWALKAAALNILSLIKEKNFLIWEKANDISFRKNCWRNISEIERPIDKKNFQFELIDSGTQELWRRFDSYVTTHYLNPLSRWHEKLLNAKQAINQKKEEIKLAQAQPEEKRKLIIEAKEKYKVILPELAKMQIELEKFKKEEIIISKKVLPAAEWGFWTWYPTSEITYKAPSNVTITHFTIVKKGDVSFQWIEQKPTLRNNHRLLSTKKPVMLNPGEEHHITFKERDVFTSIERDQVYIQYKTTKEYDLSYENEINSRKQEILRKKKDVEGLETLIENQSELIDESEKECRIKVTKLNNKIKAIEEQSIPTKKTLDSQRKNFEKAYREWHPICEILEKARMSVSSINTVEYLNISKFLRLCEECYGFSITTKVATSTVRPTHEPKGKEPVKPTVKDGEEKKPDTTLLDSNHQQRSQNPSSPHWYTHNNIRQLLNHYLDKEEVFIFTPIAADERGGRSFIDLVDQCQIEIKKQHTRWEQDPNRGRKEPTTIIIPLNKNGNHWVSLVIHFPIENRIKPLIAYIDPFGNKISSDLVKHLKTIYTELDINFIYSSSHRYQDDGYNCGPWTVELLRASVALLRQQAPATISKKATETQASTSAATTPTGTIPTPARQSTVKVDENQVFKKILTKFKHRLLPGSYDIQRMRKEHRLIYLKTNPPKPSHYTAQYAKNPPPLPPRDHDTTPRPKILNSSLKIPESVVNPSTSRESVLKGVRSFDRDDLKKTEQGKKVTVGIKESLKKLEKHQEEKNDFFSLIWKRAKEVRIFINPNEDSDSDDSEWEDKKSDKTASTSQQLFTSQTTLSDIPTRDAPPPPSDQEDEGEISSQEERFKSNRVASSSQPSTSQRVSSDAPTRDAPSPPCNQEDEGEISSPSLGRS